MAREELAKIWHKRLDDFAQSGLSVRKWCEVKGVSKYQYTYWRRRLADPGTEKSTEAGWLPIQIVEPAPVPVSPARLSVRIAHAAIDVEAGFDPALLRAIVEALGGQPC